MTELSRIRLELACNPDLPKTLWARLAFSRRELSCEHWNAKQRGASRRHLQ